MGRSRPVIGVYATLKGRRGRLARRGRMLSIEIGGRLVPGRLPEAGSSVATSGHDIGFMVCSEACSRALEAAVALDKSLSVVH